MYRDRECYLNRYFGLLKTRLLLYSMSHRLFETDCPSPNLTCVHAKPRSQGGKSIPSSDCRGRRCLHLMRQLLQQLRTSQRIHTSVFLIPHLHVVELVGIVSTQQLDCLLQLDEIVLQGDVIEAADIIGEEFDVGGELLDAIGVDTADRGREGEREDGLGGVADGVEEHEFFDLGGEREEDGGHDVAEILGKGLDIGGWFRRAPRWVEVVFG